MLHQQFIFLTILGISASGYSEAYTNVYGNELQPCSSDGMALTGFTRSGYCVDRDDDSGSHHICVDLSSATGGNFCDVTGQSDWCDEEMPCHEDADEYCQVQDWCVCQWAFASYLENAGGCDYVQELSCDAINMEAVRAYQQKSESKYVNALQCIEERCGVQFDRISMLGAFSSSHGIPFAVLLLSLVAVAVGSFTYMRKRNMSPGDQAEAHLVEDSAETTDYVAYQSGVAA